MNDAQYKEWMVEAGWSPYKVGKETHFEMQLEDRKLRVPGTYIQLSDELHFDDYSKIWVRDYATVKHALFPSMKHDCCYVASRPRASTKVAGTGSPEFFQELTKTLIEWAENVDINTEIQNAADATDRLGHFSYDHITALAFTGNTVQLQTWREKVASGETTGLAPMVTVEVLDKALEIARENRS